MRQGQAQRQEENPEGIPAPPPLEQEIPEQDLKQVGQRVDFGNDRLGDENRGNAQHRCAQRGGGGQQPGRSRFGRKQPLASQKREDRPIKHRHGQGGTERGEQVQRPGRGERGQQGQ